MHDAGSAVDLQHWWAFYLDRIELEVSLIVMKTVSIYNSLEIKEKNHLGEYNVDFGRPSRNPG
jgi:hypothetical protein